MTPSPSANALPVGALRLSDLGVIRATGAEARRFLHGQLTQAIDPLPADRARLAGYCSAKGRLLASFVVWPDGPEDVLLACSRELLAPTLKRLSMFVLRAKCRLIDATDSVPLWGLVGADAASACGPTLPPVWTHARVGDASTIRLPDARVDDQALPRALWCGSAPATGATGTGADGPPLDLDAWHGLEALAAVPRIVGATVEQFVPQMVNLELVGGVDFQKGCYPGQEVVARSQYRGAVKRRAHVFATATRLQPGDEIFADADPGQPAGMVVLAGGFGGRHVALVELKSAVLEGGGALHAGAPSGSGLTPLDLPYPIPVAAA